MKNTLIVMGSHPGTRNEFDWTREDCDILVFNEAMKMDWVKRADFVTQIHLPVIWRNPGNRNDPHHYDWLKSGNTPTILMQDKYEDVPNSVCYPLEDVIKLGRKYLTSSAAYAIAWGIVSGYERIEIYGVEMATDTEYAHQRPGVAYWIGFAEGAGVDVDYHGSLLTSPLYGYEGDIRFKYEYFDERITVLQASAKTAMDIYNEANTKANDLINEYIANWGHKQKVVIEPNEVIKLVMRQVDLAAQFGVENGALQEVIRYKKKVDAQIAATGDYMLGRQEFEHMSRSLVKERDKTIINATRYGEDCRRQFDDIQKTNSTMKRESKLKVFKALVARYVIESQKVGALDGGYKENRIFMEKLDELARMAGGDKSIEVLQAAQREAVAI